MLLVQQNRFTLNDASRRGGTLKHLAIAVLAGTTGFGGCGGSSEPTPNAIPTADAGANHAAMVGRWVELDGSGSSDADAGDSLSFRWTLTEQPANSNAVLSNSTSSTPSFPIDAEGRYEVTLVVSDGKSESSASRTVVTAQLGLGEMAPFLRSPFNGTPSLVTWVDHDLTDGTAVNFRGEVVTTQDNHLGYDWGMPEGTEVVAMADGQVFSTGNQHCIVPDFAVAIEHRPPDLHPDVRAYQTFYAHLSELLVTRGQTVVAGQVIGYLAPGNRPSCHIFNTHLHVQVSRILVDGTSEAVDPFGWRGSQTVPDDPLLQQLGFESTYLWRVAPPLPN